MNNSKIKNLAGVAICVAASSANASTSTETLEVDKFESAKNFFELTQESLNSTSIDLAGLSSDHEELCWPGDTGRACTKKRKKILGEETLNADTEKLDAEYMLYMQEQIRLQLQRDKELKKS